MVFKCKMCGGDIEQVSEHIGKCLFCKSTMTLPNSDNEKIVNLYNRANDLRMSNEFDKAYGVYESILDIDNEQIEAHWGLLLCRYGVEYVDDPKTKKKIPTCHRTIPSSIFSDNDYKKVIKKAYGDALELYQKEAEKLDNIQKEILKISLHEQPYDIFICYKETDEQEERTIDSVMAQDIYDKLIEKGYKVFFARMTLEGKLGTEYEPYIYSALTSSKVMLVVGTEEKNFNAVWVKNEWSRYLEMMKVDKEKNLIPVYSKVSPYNLPTEFAKLQAQNMDKIGAMQDLLVGIDKLLKNKKQQEDNFTYEMYEKFKKMKEEEDREIRESKEANKQVSVVYEKIDKKFSIITFFLSFLQAVVIFFLLAQFMKDYYEVFDITSMPNDFKDGIMGLVFLSCLVTLIAYFVGLISRKANKISKFFYLGNLLLCLILCLQVNSKHYQMLELYYLFIGSNFLLLTLRPTWNLKERVEYVTTEQKEEILFQNKELKKNYVRKDKKKIYLVLSCMGLIITLFTIIHNANTKLISNSNNRDTSKRQIEIIISKTPIKGNWNHKIGTAGKGDIYTILEEDKENGIEWYLVETRTGVKGWIAKTDNGKEIVKILEVEE